MALKKFQWQNFKMMFVFGLKNFSAVLKQQSFKTLILLKLKGKLTLTVLQSVKFFIYTLL